MTDIIKNSKKIIGFVMYKIELYAQFDYLIKSLLKDNNFEVVIYAFSKEIKEKLNQENIKYIDNENDFMEKKIDYIFYQTPYEYLYPSFLSFTKISQRCKICYIGYGYNIIHGKLFDNCTLNTQFYDNCSIIFSENELNTNYFKEHFPDKNILTVGCPKTEFIKELQPKKSKVFTVLWLPRWHNNHVGICSFNEIKNFMVSLIKRYIKVIFRPHPLTNYDYSDLVNISKENNYFIIEKNQEYENSFSQSDILIADPTTLMAEYFATKKPIIYFKKRQDVFNEFGEDLEKGFYVATNTSDITKYIDNILLNNDYLKPKRLELYDKHYKPYLNVIENIKNNLN